MAHDTWSGRNATLTLFRRRIDTMSSLSASVVLPMHKPRAGLNRLGPGSFNNYSGTAAIMHVVSNIRNIDKLFQTLPFLADPHLWELACAENSLRAEHEHNNTSLSLQSLFRSAPPLRRTEMAGREIWRSVNGWSLL